MRSSIRLALFGLFALTLVASSANATGELAPLQVVEDPAFDHKLWTQVEPSATPQAFDLKAAYIAETDQTIDFTWEYYDIPDGSGGLFEGNWLYWDFQIDDNDGVEDPTLFSLRARPYYPGKVGVHVHCDVSQVPVFGTCAGVGPGGGTLQGNCTKTENIVSCSTVQGSFVGVTVDDVANKVTAKVRRLDLRDASNNFVAIDGSTLTEVVIFDGISACQGAVLISAGNCDDADMTINIDEDTGAYILGQAR